MNKKNNQRYQMNEERMLQVFIDLLRDTDFHKITVKDICEGAHVNRSTFYTHFEDMYAMLDTLEKTFEKKMTEAFRNSNVNDEDFNHKEYLIIALENIKKDKEFYKIFFHGLGYQRMSWGLDTLRDTLFVPKMNKQDAYTREDFIMRYTFFKAGLVSTISKWLKNDCNMSVEHLTEILWEYAPFH